MAPQKPIDVRDGDGKNRREYPPGKAGLADGFASYYMRRGRPYRYLSACAKPYWTLYKDFRNETAGETIFQSLDAACKTNRRQQRLWWRRSLTVGLLWACQTTYATTPPPTAQPTFLVENRARDGIVELPSGLQYKPLVNGTGRFHPQPLCQCLVHYEGKLLDGSDHVFDSSYERGEPLRVSPSQVIDGWNEAMHMMVEGDKWELYIPPELGYGERGQPPDIPGNVVLQFTMDMIAVDCEQRIPALKCQLDADENSIGEGCSERESKYVERISGWSTDKVMAEITRLGSILAEETNPLREDLKEWVIRREYILKQQYRIRVHSNDKDEEL